MNYLTLTLKEVLTHCDWRYRIIYYSIFCDKKQKDGKVTYILRERDCGKYWNQFGMNVRNTNAWLRQQPDKTTISLNDGYFCVSEQDTLSIFSIANMLAAKSRNEFIRFTLYMYGSIKWAEALHSGFIRTEYDMAQDVGLNIKTIHKYIEFLLKEQLIKRSWVGNNLINKGSCYMLVKF